MKTALVTGAAGFLGSHLCERLLNEGYKVIALDDLSTGSKANLKSFARRRNFSFIKADVFDIKKDSSDEDIKNLFETKIDEIYNLACPASPAHYQRDPSSTLMTSIGGAVKCSWLAAEHKAKMLHCSTSEVYGDPLIHPQDEHYWGNVNPIGVRSCYDEGKRVAETMLADVYRMYNVDVRIVRIFNTYGPRMHPQDGRVVSNFIMQALKNKNITIYGDGSQTRSFQYCDDLIDAFRLYMELPKERIREFFEEAMLEAPVINVGNPSEYTIKQLAKMTLKLIPESKSKIVYRPLPKDDPRKRKPDIKLAKRLLGWKPTVPLEEGLTKTIDYFRKLRK